MPKRTPPFDQDQPSGMVNLTLAEVDELLDLVKPGLDNELRRKLFLLQAELMGFAGRRGLPR